MGSPARSWLLLVVLWGCAEQHGSPDDGGDAPTETTTEARTDDGTDGFDTGACPAGRSRCPSGCTDLTTDPANCGACGHLCGAGEVCNEGACASTCSTGLRNCSGACVDVATDETHCGTCGNTCEPVEECVAGVCTCEPSCTGRACGPDECGGTCPPGCGPGYTCSETGACSCGGTVCGSSCCGAGQICLGSSCCTPSCTGRSCGSDGCSGSCPPGCGSGYTCSAAGACTCPGPVCGSTCCAASQVCSGVACCTPSCSGRTCGSNGCGGTCPPGCEADYACSTSGTCVRSVWVFEAEGAGMGHMIGRADEDGWSAATGSDEDNYMLFGPYATDIPAGTHSAAFRLMVDNNTADDLTVVRLEAYDHARDDILSQRDVHRREFTAPFAYQDFSISFTSASGSELEFRIFWTDVSYVRCDKVTVR